MISPLSALLITLACRVSIATTVKWANIESSKGDKFPDFSYAGYKSSDESIPSLSDYNVTVTVSSTTTRDWRPAIQSAINNVSSQGGGIVKLPAGTLNITAGIQLLSNVVLTGSGNQATTLNMRLRPSVPVITLGRNGTIPKATFGDSSNITDSYVPIGSSVVNVEDGSLFTVGQTVYISRTVTADWVRYNGMSNLVRDGVQETWIAPGKTILSPNIISAINGSEITLQIPLTDALNLEYMAPVVWAYTPPTLTSGMGVQNLRIEAPRTCSGFALDNSLCNVPAVNFASWTVDSWATDLALIGFNQFFGVDRYAARITIQDSTMNRNRDIEGSSLPFDILIAGSQILVKDCSQIGIAKARCFTFATDSITPGPNVVTGHVVNSTSQTIYPHQRWAQGLLVENTSVSTKFVNRGTMGTGHGWTINGGVGWNLRGPAQFQSPPLGINWCIGCGSSSSRPTGNATIMDKAMSVRPTSLFAAQLVARGA